MTDRLDESIQFIKGVGPARAQLFNKLGVFTLRDLIHHFPRSYEDMTRPLPVMTAPMHETVPVIAAVTVPARTVRARPGMELAKARAADATGSTDIVFFNRRYSAQSLERGQCYLFYGKIEGTPSAREMVNPYFEKCAPDGRGRILPLYPLTEGLTQSAVRRAVEGALSVCDAWDEVVSEPLRRRYGLCAREYAIRNIHAPRDAEALALARKRLVFEELLVFSLALSRLKRAEREKSPLAIDTGVDLSPLFAALGFELTGAQRRALDECLADYRTPYCQNRLIQGDVGSGKTAVACALFYLFYKNKLQSALMAPTEVLAAQHYASLSALMEPLGLKVGLLCGSTPPKQRRQTLDALADGTLDLIIGTHALISEGVVFARAGLVVTDEQHRFGVAQREALRRKGLLPHVVVMSATPIPRTLALILYADLDVSVIDELPPGRKPVKTYSVTGDYRERIYAFVQKQAQAGRQAYIIAARALDDETSELKSVRELCDDVRSRCPGLCVQYLHGKMGGAQKERILTDFAAGSIQALVSTTVVEVGINVPNATVMVIENAERFGLSQLHQLRGRVGRGAEESFCILISDAGGDEAQARLKVMCATNDGFEISRRDLELRGPGEFFGQRQSGLVRFRIADLMTDMDAVLLARDAADDILSGDPSLSAPDHAPLARAVARVLERCDAASI